MDNDFFQRLACYAVERENEVLFQNLKEDGREVLTYSKFWRESSDLAVCLVGLGLSPGERLGLLMEDGPRWGVAFVAGFAAGLVLVPLDPGQSETSLCTTILDAGCRALIVSDGHYTAAAEIRRAGVEVIILTAGETASITSSHGVHILGAAATPIRLPLVKRDADDDLAILYTGGTTGAPKGVRLSEANIFWTIRDMAALFDLTKDDHILSVLPLFHIMSLLANLLGPLYVGFRATYIQSREPERVLEAFRSEGITVFLCVPQFYYVLLRRINDELARQPWFKRLAFRRLIALSRILRRRLRLDVGKLFFSAVHARFGSSFRLFGVGGAMFAESSAELLRDLGFHVFQAYGMTETSGPATITPPGLDIGLTCGPPMQHVEVKIADPDPEGIGEILIRGEHVTKGYWNAPEATAALFSSGWLRSGDLGYLDAKGRLRVTGRRKEVLVLSSGKNVFPEPLETHYQSGSPFIKEICILAVADPNDGHEKLHAVVVPDLERLNQEKIFNIADRLRYDIEGLSSTLPLYERVHSFEIRTEALPRTSTRKLKRFAISPRQTAPTTPKTKRPACDDEPPLFQALRAVKAIEGDIEPSMNLELDLDFESLERYALFATLRDRFGLMLSEEEAGRIATVGELMRLVEGRTAQITEATDWRNILAKPLTSDQSAASDDYFRPSLLFPFFLFALSRLLRLALGLIFGFKIVDVELLPKAGAFLICANHTSFLDACLIACAVPYDVFRRMFYYGASKYGRTQTMQLLWRLLRVVSVDPDANLGTALRIGREGLDRGFVLCVFPEGHRSVDGVLRPFRKGPAILSVELKSPIVPVAVLGAHQVWRRGSNRIRIHPLEVRFGGEIAPIGETFDTLTAHAQAAVSRLLEPTSREIAPSE